MSAFWMVAVFGYRLIGLLLYIVSGNCKGSAGWVAGWLGGYAN